MILSNNQIKETIDKGNIQITPFEYSQIEPASYDLRIENRGQLLYPFYFENPDTYFKKLEEYKCGNRNRFAFCIRGGCKKYYKT